MNDWLPIPIERIGSWQAWGGNDTLWGVTAGDVVLGGFGVDTIRGGSGDDYLCGEYQADEILGGSGNDTVWGGQGNQVGQCGW